MTVEFGGTRLNKGWRSVGLVMGLGCALMGCRAGEGDGSAPALAPAPLTVGPAAPPATGTTAPALPSRIIVKLAGALHQGLAGASRGPRGAIDLGAAGRTDPALAGLIASAGVRAAAPLYLARFQLAQKAGLADADLTARVRQRFAARAARRPAGALAADLSGTYVLDVGPRTRADLDRLLAGLRTHPGVVYAEEDQVSHVTFTPNDPHFTNGDLYGLLKIQAPAAWDSAQGQGVVVAIVDTGIDYHHPDIVDNVWTNGKEIPGNGVDDDGNGFVDDVRGWNFVSDAGGPNNDPFDDNGHGSHVAGTVAAEGNNGIGVIGVAWKAQVMAVKGIDSEGIGIDSELAPAIVYAADNGADVINASWGGGLSPVIQDAVAHAISLGVVFVAAAGNSSADSATFFPASFPHVISVAATDETDQLADFSNFGHLVELAAPGVDILSLEAGTGGYVSLSGTSMASPHVSGAAALVLGLHPQLTVDEVRAVLRASATDLGPPGKDSTYGYGRLDAAGAVAVGQVLDVQIAAPAEGTVIAGPVAVTGTASGPGLAGYVLDFGAGESPTTFSTIAQGTTPVTAGSLGTFDPGSMPEGTYTLRLRATSTGGVTFIDQVQVSLNYVSIAAPEPSPAPPVAQVFKPGSPIPIVGRAAGSSFHSFVIDHAPGRDATAGFSTAGVTLVGGGTAPIFDASLGSWTTAANLAGEQTLRLTVQNADSIEQKTTMVYLEPDLASTGWPQFVPGVAMEDEGLVPARAGDGSTHFIVCGGSPTCYSFPASGGQPATAFVEGGLGDDFPAAVGDLDPAPGQEVVVADGEALRLFSADLTPLRQITSTNQERYGASRIFLADLDGDGAPEIVAVGRSPDGTTSSLDVYRSNGQLFSSHYPLVMSNAPLNVPVVAADLDGDGRKELLMMIADDTFTHYTVTAVRADGTPYTPWPSPTFPFGNTLPVVADLDHDGRPEIVIREGTGTANDVRVLNADGSTRAGFPTVNLGGIIKHADVLVADLDGDGTQEMVLGVPGGLLVLRGDGSTYGTFSWPMADSPGRPVIADVDGDSHPDIVAAYDLNTSENGVSFMDERLRAISRTGALIKEWRLMGQEGLYPQTATPAVGDFLGTGQTTIVAHVPLSTGVPGFGDVTNSLVTMLTTGAPFNPSLAEWPLIYGDPQGSVTAPVTVKTTTVGPVADAYVRDGSSAGTNFGKATNLDIKSTSAAGNNRLAYLRFSLTGASGAVTFAKLRLFGHRTAASAADDATYGVADTSWSETGVTWNNRPVLSARQTTAVIGTTAQYYEWDVTPWVQSQKLAGATATSFAVLMDTLVNDSPDTFNSREAGSNPPQLVLSSSPDAPPTVAVPAAASPSPVTGTSTALSVLGADDHGEAALVYTWSATGPAPVAFSGNGSNAAKMTTATFSAAGAYAFVVTIRDAAGQTAQSSVSVTVQRTVTSIAVTPASATVATGGQQAFTASASDQFGVPLSPQPTFTWSVSGGGTISASGVFTGGSTAGPFVVTAASGGKSGTASVTVAASTTTTIAPAADGYVQDGGSAGTNFGSATSLLVKTSSSAGTNRVTYLRFSLTGVSGTVTTAKLRLFGSRPVTSSSTDSAFAVASNSWTETGLTWNNKPALGTKQGTSVTVTPTAKYYEWDVTAFVKAQKAAAVSAASLAVKMDQMVNDSPDTFNAREAAANRPQLVITSSP